MQSHLQTLFSPDNLTLHLFHRDSQLLSRHSSWVSHRLEEIFSQRSILLHLLENVKKIEVQKESSSDRIINSPQTPLQRILEIRCESGLKVESNYIFWVTQASAPRWLKESGITTDSQGFILVGDTLQSVSHPHIFAAGDIATLENHPCPKAGVFAVRQGKPLFENLQSIIQGKSLKKYLPQKHYLSLIGTGDKKAIASWSIFGWESHLMWVWKDYIDRKFMRMFTEYCPRVSVVSHHSSLR